jgi:hypothetical protein
LQYLKDLGYDGSELYKKGRFRPGTFWKSNRVLPYGAALHRDRCLIMAFSPADTDTEASFAVEGVPAELTWVANVHLAAGDGAERIVRRFRTICDCVDTIRKEQSKVLASVTKAKKEMSSSKSKGSNMVAPLYSSNLNFGFVIAGDMNVDSLCYDPTRPMATAVEAFLTQGNVGPEFIEEGCQITSKLKVNKLGLLLDAYEFAYRSNGKPPPPTMVLEELYGVLTQRANTLSSCSESASAVEEGEKESSHVLSPLGLELVEKVFFSFASVEIISKDGVVEKVMGYSDVVRWLTKINKQVGRGSEFRAAVAAMSLTVEMKSSGSESHPTPYDIAVDIDSSKPDPEVALPLDGYITKSAFTEIYQEEIQLGKVWGVSYDLSVCGYGLPISSNLFKSRFDRFFVGGKSYRGDYTESGSINRQILLAVRETNGELMINPTPNVDLPSDHLSIFCVVSWRED